MNLRPEHGEPLTVGELISALLNFDPASPVAMVKRAEEEGAEVSPAVGVLYHPDHPMVLLLALDDHAQVARYYEEGR